MTKIIKYFTELLNTLKSIDSTLKSLEKSFDQCTGEYGYRSKRKTIRTAHWNDSE